MLRFNGNKIPLHLKRFLLDVRHLKHVYKHGKTNAPTSEMVPHHSQVFFEFTMWVKSKHRTNTLDRALKMITASNREKASFGLAGKWWLTWLSVQESLPFNECLERNPCLRCFIFVGSCLTRMDLSHLRLRLSYNRLFKAVMLLIQLSLGSMQMCVGQCEVNQGSPVHHRTQNSSSVSNPGMLSSWKCLMHILVNVKWWSQQGNFNFLLFKTLFSLLYLSLSLALFH